MLRAIGSLLDLWLQELEGEVSTLELTCKREDGAEEQNARWLAAAPLAQDAHGGRNRRRGYQSKADVPACGPAQKAAESTTTVLRGRLEGATERARARSPLTERAPPTKRKEPPRRKAESSGPVSYPRAEPGPVISEKRGRARAPVGNCAARESTAADASEALQAKRAGPGRGHPCAGLCHHTCGCVGRCSRTSRGATQRARPRGVWVGGPPPPATPAAPQRPLSSALICRNVVGDRAFSCKSRSATPMPQAPGHIIARSTSRTSRGALAALVAGDRNGNPLQTSCKAWWAWHAPMPCNLWSGHGAPMRRLATLLLSGAGARAEHRPRRRQGEGGSEERTKGRQDPPQANTPPNVRATVKREPARCARPPIRHGSDVLARSVDARASQGALPASCKCISPMPSVGPSTSSTRCRSCPNGDALLRLPRPPPGRRAAGGWAAGAVLERAEQRGQWADPILRLLAVEPIMCGGGWVLGRPGCGSLSGGRRGARQGHNPSGSTTGCLGRQRAETSSACHRKACCWRRRHTPRRKMQGLLPPGVDSAVRAPARSASSLLPKHDLRIPLAECPHGQRQVVGVLHHPAVAPSADVLRHVVRSTIDARLQVLAKSSGG